MGRRSKESPAGEGPALFADGPAAVARGERQAGALESLNAAQRRAVTHDRGPLIVLAGPGTGKTRVIAQRVAHMIRERRIEPEQIVATTFSVKAAEQLRERFAAAVGSSIAERVNAHTLHGFGLRLLKRYADRLDLPPVMGSGTGGGGGGGGGGAGRARRCDLIDSAQSRRMLRRLILDEDLFGHARAAGLESIIVEAEAIFRFFDDRALAPEDVVAGAARWAEAAANGIGPDGSPLDDAQRTAATAAQARFADFARLHALFDQERRAAGLLTYGDLLLLPIRLLRRHADVAARCRSEFRHWLVDEFQDVNLAQIELLRLLAMPSPGVDICVVGDDDQAIYGFRGADDQAFKRFAAIWTDATVVELSENYRSRPRLIAVANSVIGRAVDRFAPDKQTVFPPGKNSDPPGIVECVQLERETDDGEVIAAMIRLDAHATPAVSTDAGGTAKARYSRYAVVARNHGDLDRIAEALWLEGVPTLRWGRGSAAENEGVQDIFAWARLLVSPRNGWHARRILLRPPLELPLELVNGLDQRYRAAVARSREGLGVARGEPPAPDPGEFPAWLRREAAGDEPLIAKFCDWFEQFAFAVTQESGAAVLVRIVRETGVVHADLPDERRRAQRVESVVAMLNFAQERLARLPDPRGLREFLEYYDDLDDRERGFGVPSGERSIDSVDEPEEADTTDAVRLLTAHASKGLEFDTVFVPRVQPPHGYPDTKNRDEPVVVADVTESGLFGRDDRNAQERGLAEERRVFYVACTRAERRLVLLPKKMKGRSTSTHFVEELLDDDSVRSSVTVVGGGDVLASAAQKSGMGVGGDALRGMRSGSSEDAAGGVRDRRRELFERARREVRLAAAGALGTVDSRTASAGTIAGAREVLSEAATRMAAIAVIEAGGQPEVASLARLGVAARRSIDDLAAASGIMVEAARKSKGHRSSWVTRVPTAPLDLSYTTISDYLRCPRCYYVKHVLKYRVDEGRSALLGGALHRALERFYIQFREADAVGSTRPELQQLLALARDEFVAHAPVDHEVDRAEFDQLLAQVRLGFERLHRGDIHVLETEYPIRLEYRRQGEEKEPAHRLTGKVDRIDQITMADGSVGFRIVDYKTGQPWKALREPAEDDLQLGIYAMALRAEYGPDVRGVAEYWLFATGERGELALSDVNEEKVRKKIDGVIAGILGGQFEKAGKCDDGPCTILDVPGSTGATAAELGG